MVWNSLPNDCKNASSLKTMLTAQLDIFVLNCLLSFLFYVFLISSGKDFYLVCKYVS